MRATQHFYPSWPLHSSVLLQLYMIKRPEAIEPMTKVSIAKLCKNYWPKFGFKIELNKEEEKKFLSFPPPPPVPFLARFFGTPQTRVCGHPNAIMTHLFFFFPTHDRTEKQYILWSRPEYILPDLNQTKTI